MPGTTTRRWPNLPDQAVSLIFAMGFLISGCRLDARVELQPCKNGVAPEKQIELGQKAAQQVYQQTPVLPDTSPATAYIRTLGQKLVAQAPGYKWPYSFHVANVAEVNAFALPGGTMFVNLGTIQAAANEAQLAAVMAHEISHVVLQHSVCNAEKQQRVGLIAGLGQIAAGVLLGDGAGQLAQQGIGLTAGLGFLKMSRGAEQQADLMGVGILYDAGYDPHAMAQFFETLAQKYGKGSSQFMSDHPNPGNRSEYVAREVSGFVVKANYVTNTPAFTQIHNQVASMHAYTSKEVSSGIWKNQDPNQTVSDGVNQLNGPAVATAAPDLNISGPWKTFHGAGYSIQLPGNWQGAGTTQASMFGPPGGIAGSADGRPGSLIYGVLTDRFQPANRGSLDTAFNALVADMARDNPGLEPGPANALVVGRSQGRIVDGENRSSNNGRGEHDRIVAFQSRGVLRYFVFVAPSPDFQTMKPTFDTILQSIVFD